MCICLQPGVLEVVLPRGGIGASSLCGKRPLCQVQLLVNTVVCKQAATLLSSSCCCSWLSHMP
jgi:hypothetical protein